MNFAELVPVAPSFGQNLSGMTPNAWEIRFAILSQTPI